MAEMIMDGIIALNKAKKYTAESLDGLGAMNAAINANAENIANLQSEIGDIETVLSSVVEV